MYSGKHMQEPALFRSLQTALAPHGEGKHGLIWSSGGGVGISNTVHCWNGLPEYPGRHAQFGVCDTTLHSAFNPHMPLHGSLHF